MFCRTRRTSARKGAPALVRSLGDKAREIGKGLGVLLSLGLSGAVILGACSSESEASGALVTDVDLPGLVEVHACAHSHEHDLRHVQIFADPQSADLFQTCVIDQDCTEPFPPGSLFVKREYDLEGCKPENLTSITATLKLEPGELPEGGDWQWQRMDPDLTVTDDGAPAVCLNCHEDHCSEPFGFDLRCVPDL